MRIGMTVRFTTTGRYPRTGRGRIVDSKTGKTGAWFAVRTDDDGRVISVRPTCMTEVRRAQ